MAEDSSSSRLALIVGASRGLGAGLARELLGRGWHVIATARGKSDALASLGGSAGGQLEVEHVDIAVPDEVSALRRRLDGRALDLLFVNAGVANGAGDTIARMSAEEFTRILVTNTLSPLRVIEAFQDLVPHGGVIGAMSSSLGSVALNESGGWETYRASKAGLNTLLRSFAARSANGRAVVAMDPGWVRTDMGGANATLDVATSTRGVAEVLEARLGRPGMAYLNYRGETLPW